MGVGAVLHEVRTRALAGAFMPGKAAPWETLLRDLDGIGAGRSIVIQPGLTAHAPYYEPAKRLFNRLGFDTSVSHVRGHGLNSIPDDAAQLRHAVKDASERSLDSGGNGLVTVIGHSEGGPSSRFALQRLGMLPYVDQLVTWGGVHNGVKPLGTRINRVLDQVPAMAAVKDLSATGPLIRGLNADLTGFMGRAAVEQPGFRMVSIAGDMALPKPLGATDGLVSVGAAHLDDRIAGLHNLVLHDRGANHNAIAGTGGGMFEPSMRGAALLAGRREAGEVAEVLRARGTDVSG